MLQREFRILQSNIQLKLPLLDPAAREKNNLKNAIVKGEFGKVKKILEKTPRMINTVNPLGKPILRCLIDIALCSGS
jgi:hypothetical protein